MTNAYENRIDPEIQAYIDLVESLSPAADNTGGADTARINYARMCAHFHAGYPDGIVARDETIGSVPVRRYLPGETIPRGVIIYLHGGGFVVGDLETHDSVCADLCHRTGFELVAVDYRLSPENAHPAALDDGKAVFSAIAGEGDRPIVLCGDSAGANLCAAISHWARGQSRQPAGQVLIYPELGGDTAKGSYQEHANAPQLTLADIHHYRRIRNDDHDHTADPTAFPLLDTDFANLPPTAIFCAELDPLCDDGPEYAGKLAAAGGQAQCTVEQGLVHGYLRARYMSQKAGDSFARICESLENFGKNK